MSKSKKTIFTLCVLAAGLLAGGCGQKRIESTQVPQQAEPNEVVPAGKASAPPAPGRYQVARHDNLWDIAGRPGIYGDSFQWPQLYKANRDQISDPDLIYPRQELKVQKGYSLEEMRHARHLALATPKYAPHSKPREALPLDYF